MSACVPKLDKIVAGLVAGDPSRDRAADLHALKSTLKINDFLPLDPFSLGIFATYISRGGVRLESRP